MPKLCQYYNCCNKASYAEYYNKPIRCKTHKENYNHQYRICHCGKSRPTFNFEGMKQEYCKLCKLDKMINVIDKKCKCGKSQPSFNFKGLKPIFCKLCKTEEMVDLKHSKCFCGKARPTFNFINNEANFCVNCKSEGMIDVKHSKCFCSKARPTFNFINNEAKFCVNCQSEGMIDVLNKKCKANFCLGTLGNPKYNGYCTNCYNNLFPLDPLTSQIRSKTKEIIVRNYINNNFEGFTHDKVLWSGNCDCTHRRRIDHYKLIGNTLLCIETDENHHKDYNKNDEEIRYNDLYMLHSGKFVFIRFNPDKYKNNNNKYVNPIINTRLPILKEEIEKQIDRIQNDKNNELLEIIKLYYNVV
jgi:hypothetical protein